MRSITDQKYKDKGRKLLSKTSKRIDVNESLSTTEDWINDAYGKKIITTNQYVMYSRLHRKLREVLLDYDIAINIIKKELE